MSTRHDFRAGWPILTMSGYALRQGILNQHVLLTYGALGGYVASILALFFPITSFAGLGALHVEATRVGSDTVLARLARFVEESKAMKPPIVLLADQVLKTYVPGVMLISLLSLVGWMLLSTPVNALFAALSVAVIGYPCALGLSTPLALMRGTGLGAERGVLIRRNPEQIQRYDHLRGYTTPMPMHRPH